MSAKLPAVLKLQREVDRGRLTIRFVGRVNPTSVGVRRALVEGYRNIARPDSFDEVTQKTREAKDGVHRVAVPIHHVRQHRVVGAKNVDRGVD
jgi:hypothetical protein